MLREIKTHKIKIKITAATYLAVATGLDCFCFSSITSQCCSPANGCLCLFKTYNAVMQKGLSFFCSDSGSDADSFYGSVERPIDIKYSHHSADNEGDNFRHL